MHFFEFWAIIGYVLYVIQLSMKKLFVQLWQWVIKHKKRLIYGALALFIGQICFFNLWWIGVENTVYADDPSQDKTENADFQSKATEKFALLQLFHKLCYVLIYPILIVAWKLVDNSLVYAEVFGFDSVLWQLWVIVRNIANFTLWFIFVFYIFQHLIHPSDKKYDLKWIILKSLIAWIGIQASWFIMAALIDVSTIVTYGVWWLPLSVLKDDSDSLKYNPYVLWNVIYVEWTDLQSYHMYLSNQSFLPKENKSSAKFISQCETFIYTYEAPSVMDGKNHTYYEEIILAPQMVYYFDDEDKTYYPTEQLLCHLWDEVYRFSNLYKELEWPKGDDTSESGWKDAQIKYKNDIEKSITNLQNILLYLDIQEDYIDNWIILLVWDAHAWYVWQWSWPLWGQYEETDEFGLDTHNKWLWEDSNWHLPRLNDILSWNYAWVFTALYGSLLNAGTNLRFWATSDKSLYIQILNASISLWHAVAVAIPLIAMLIVFIMRIWVLWMAIVLSPLIVLLRVFKLEESDFIKNVSILKHLQVKNLIWIIFSPAVICFAISLSTVLVRIINAVNWKDIETESQPILWWIIELNLAGITVDIWKLICCVIWIAITWFLVWTAVKSSSLWHTKIVEGAETLAKTTLWSLPVIPIPGTDKMMWVNTIFGWNGQQWIIEQMWNKLKSKYETKTSQALDERSNPEKSKEAAVQRSNKYKLDTYITGLTKSASITSAWQTAYSINTVDSDGNTITTTFANLDSWEKKKVIEAINKIEDPYKRAQFKVSSTIEINGENYTFYEKDETGEKIINQFLTEEEWKNFK